MVTEVEMKRSLFGYEIRQKSKSEYFSATDLTAAGNQWRQKNNLSLFNLAQFLQTKSSKEFIEELEKKYGQKVIQKGRGRSSGTWVHPLLFIDIALNISPKLKIEAYDWLFDNLIKHRNDSGDSYKEMAAAIYTRYPNHKKFQSYIQEVAMLIKKECQVKDWESAAPSDLEKRDRIHRSIKTLCNVLNNTDQAVRLGLKEY